MNTQFKFYLIILIFLLVSQFTIEENSESEIMDMTAENEQDLIKSSSVLFILFYNNSCGICNNYEKSMNEALEIIKYESDRKTEWAVELTNLVTFLKVEGDKNPQLADKYFVNSFPNLKLIKPDYDVRKDVHLLLDAEIVNGEKLVKYLRKRLIKQWNEITSIEHLKEVNAENSINLLVCEMYKDFENGKFTSDIIKTIESAVNYHIDVTLSHVQAGENYIKVENFTRQIPTYNKTLTEFLKCSDSTPQIILYKKFDEKIINFIKTFNKEIKENKGKVDVQLLDFFLTIYANPVVRTFDYETLQFLLRKQFPTALYLYKDKNNTKGYSTYYSYAKKHYRNILFLKDKISSKFSSSITDTLDLKEFDIPLILAFKMKNDDLLKFRLDGEITNQSINRFFSKFNKDELNNLLVSEKMDFTNPYYSKDNGSVYKYVRSIFDEEVINRSNKYCVIIFPFVDKILSTIFFTLHKASQKINQISEFSYGIEGEIKVGIINFTKNELPEINSPLYIYLFKNGQPKKMNKDLSVKNVINFLYKNECFEKKITNLELEKIKFTEEEEEEFSDENPFGNKHSDNEMNGNSQKNTTSNEKEVNENIKSDL